MFHVVRIFCNNFVRQFIHDLYTILRGLSFQLVLDNDRLRTQTYFRLSLGSAENNVYETEPENDFCDVMTFVFSLANQIA